MKTVTLIRCVLLGLTFVVFGLNGLWQTKSQRRQAMSYSILTLLTRNLHDVFGENDPVRRRAAIDEIFTKDCVFYEPSGHVYHGRRDRSRRGLDPAYSRRLSISANWRARGTGQCRANPMGRGPPW